MASKNEAKIKFSADTASFTGEIKKLNTSMSNTRAELKLNATQLKGTGDQVELLKKRHELLSKEMEQAKAKTEALTRKQESANEIFGEGSDEAQKLATQILNAQNAEASIQNEIDRVNASLEEQAEESDGATSALDELTETIARQESELSSLTNEYMNAVLEFGEGSDEADELASEIDALSSELETNKNRMESAQSAADSLTQSMSEAGSEADEAGTLIEAALSKISGIVPTLDVSSALDLVCTAVKDISQELYDLNEEILRSKGIIAQGTGATGSDLKNMTDIARECYESVQDADMNLEKMASIVADTNTQFLVTDDELKELSIKMANFARVTGTDANADVALLAQTMRTFGMDVSEMPELMDKLVYSSQASGKSAYELASAIQGNSDKVKELGFSYDEMLTMLSEVGWSNGKASETINDLRTAFKRLEKEGVEDIPGTLQVAIQAIEDFDGKTVDLNTTVGDTGLTLLDVFGADRGAQFAESIKITSENVGALGFSLDNANGSLETTLANSITTSDKIAQIGAGARNTVTDLDSFAGVLDMANAAASGTVDTYIAMSNKASDVASQTESTKSSMEGMESAISSASSAAGQSIVDYDSLKTSMDSASKSSDLLKKSADASMKSISTSASTNLPLASSTVQREIDKIKNSVNFTWGLPYLAMPHVRVTGQFSVNPPSAPDYSVSWYAKGAVFSKPTIFGTNAGLKGVGEAGPEAVAPVDVLQSYIMDAVDMNAGIDYDRLASAIAKQPIIMRLNNRDIGRAERS